MQSLFSEFDKLTIPTSAFIIFESDDFKELAIDYEGEGTVLGEKMVFSDASEPTDIIWENRHFTTADYFKRQLIAFSLVALVLAVSFFTIFKISSYSAKVGAVFPPVDCEGVADMYEGDFLR